MKCAGCAGTVESALRGAEGVRRSDVDLEGSRATVVADDGVRLVELVRAVEEAGYAVRAGGERRAAEERPAGGESPGGDERYAGGESPAGDERPAGGDR